MPDKTAVWDNDLEEGLEKAGQYPDREEQSKDENIQSAILHLETQLESIRIELRQRELTKNENKKVLDIIEKIQKEIVKLQKISDIE